MHVLTHTWEYSLTGSPLLWGDSAQLWPLSTELQKINIMLQLHLNTFSGSVTLDCVHAIETSVWTSPPASLCSSYVQTCTHKDSENCHWMLNGQTAESFMIDQLVMCSESYHVPLNWKHCLRPWLEGGVKCSCTLHDDIAFSQFFSISHVSHTSLIEGLRTRVVYPTIKCGEWPEMPKKWYTPFYQSAQISKLLNFLQLLKRILRAFSFQGGTIRGVVG